MGNAIVHFEIIGKDAAQLKEFYSELFGWKIGELMPDMGNYGLIDGRASGLAGGVGQSDDGTSALDRVCAGGRSPGDARSRLSRSAAAL